MGQRLLFIDGLRGIACLMVVAFHISETAMPSSVRSVGYSVFDFGRYGISVFFVISGFVIAYALRNTPRSAAAAIDFIARRFIRLGIPYWFVLIVTQVLDRPAVSVASFAAHSVYLQGLLGHPQMNAVFWTLCLEIQFYLLFLLLRWISFRSGLSIGVVASPLLAASLLTLGFPSELNYPPGSLNAVTWIVPFFASFYLGIVACSVYCNRSIANHRLFLIALAACSIRLAGSFEWWLLFSVVTAVAIYAATSGERMSIWLSSAPLQFIGRISYSLYLWHMLVIGFVVFRIDSRLLAFTSSIAASAVLYIVVERPSVWASRRLFA